MSDQYDMMVRAADVAARRLGRAPIGIVLGSGLSEALDNLEHPRFVDYSELPGMPEPSTAGHRGALLHGHCGDVPVLAMCGRVHMYEGRSNAEVAMPVRLLFQLGVHTLIVTSAVGSADPDLLPGHVMLVEDHINFSGRNVLMGEYEPRFGSRFPDMTNAYDPELLEIVEDTARLGDIPVSRGVLAQFLGPTYETPSEVAVATLMGARVVSMSMVPDVVVARQCGMRVAGLACVTNMAAGLGDVGPSHDDVLATSATHIEIFQTLCSGLLQRLGHDRERSP